MRRLRWAVLVTEQFGKKPQSCRLRNLCEHLPEFFRHVLDQVWSAVKLSRSRLKEFEPSDAIALGGDEGLMRVKGGIEAHQWGPQQSAGALGSCKEQSRMLECTGSGQQSFYVVPPPSSALFWVDREVFPL